MSQSLTPKYYKSPLKTDFDFPSSSCLHDARISNLYLLLRSKRFKSQKLMHQIIERWMDLITSYNIGKSVLPDIYVQGPQAHST